MESFLLYDFPFLGRRLRRRTFSASAPNLVNRNVDVERPNKIRHGGMVPRAVAARSGDPAAAAQCRVEPGGSKTS
ncbi:hypothetical protein BSLA_03f0708 [Burkholderia stabilis]|nr:hypothetical protein BSLA_03f0708 [Burkholderia stabilis]